VLVTIIQARMTSSRLPGKVLADIGGKPALQLMIERAKRARRARKIIVATTTNPTDDPVVELCGNLEIETYRGGEHDVLKRYREAAETAGASSIVRLTADCPMIDPLLVDEVVLEYEKGEWDYAATRGYPVGLDAEVFSLAALITADNDAHHPYLREHVTPFINGDSKFGHGSFRCAAVRPPADFGHIRWTVDRIDDLERVRELVSRLPENFTWLQALSIATQYPHLLGLISK
jgi:spore coat polysaccharide biosynthesis protein SpsF